jgi:ribosomal protein S18 acetylase RimI-like enzyme
MNDKGGPVELLAPCGKCRLIKDRETGYIAGPDVMRFRTFNGSSRFVWQVSGRTVAALWVQGDSELGYIEGVAVSPDYQNAGFLLKLYQTATRYSRRLRLSPTLDDNRDTAELIKGLTNAT